MELTNIEQYLPSSFETTNLIFENTEEENRCLTFRCKLRNAEEVKKWLFEFSKRSGTSYILRSSHVHTFKFDYTALYLCHHSDHNKIEPEKNKRGISKNLHCSAGIKFSIKKNTRSTRTRDKYIKDGYQTVISIRYKHNHMIRTLEAYSSLRPVKETREIFLGYFENGFNIADAIAEHKRVINYVPSSLEAANAHTLPKERTIRYWYDEWHKIKYGSKEGPDHIEKLNVLIDKFKEDGFTILLNEKSLTVAIGLQCSEIQQINETCTEVTAEQPTSISATEEDDNERESEDMKNAEKLVEKSVELLLEKFAKYGCSEKAAGKFYTACKNISTRNALETLMFNTKRNTVHRSNARIKVQTTSVARRKNVKRLKRK